MKKIINIIPFLTIIFLISCKSTPNTILNEDSKLNSAKRAAVILRTPQKTMIMQEDVISNLTKWISGYKKVRPVTFISSEEESLTEYTDSGDAFYQIDSENNFLEYRSLGTIKLFLKENEEIIKNTMLKDNSDILVIYEIKAAYSEEMENLYYSTLITVIDKNMSVIFLDHFTKYESVKTLNQSVKTTALNRISNRLISFLTNYKFIEELR